MALLKIDERIFSHPKALVADNATAGLGDRLPNTGDNPRTLCRSRNTRKGARV